MAKAPALDEKGRIDLNKMSGLLKASRSYRASPLLQMTNQPGEWIMREYADLTEQHFTIAGAKNDLFLEKMEVCSPGYRVVRRSDTNGDAAVKCPPVISGPHDTLEAGKAAYIMALATL